MKIVASNGKRTVKLTKEDWIRIGKKVGWIKVAHHGQMYELTIKIDENGNISFEASHGADISEEALKKQIEEGEHSHEGVPEGVNLNSLLIDAIAGELGVEITKREKISGPSTVQKLPEKAPVVQETKKDIPSTVKKPTQLSPLDFKQKSKLK